MQQKFGRFQAKGRGVAGRDYVFALADTSFAEEARSPSTISVRASERARALRRRLRVIDVRRDSLASFSLSVVLPRSSLFYLSLRGSRFPAADPLRAVRIRRGAQKIRRRDRLESCGLSARASPVSSRRKPFYHFGYRPP